MVKERDEQMNEAENKAREEKKRRRKEWWEKFKRRAARITSISVPVLFLVGIGYAGFLISQNFPDGWPFDNRDENALAGCEKECTDRDQLEKELDEIENKGGINKPTTKLPNFIRTDYYYNCEDVEMADDRLCVTVDYATVRQLGMTERGLPGFNALLSDRLHYGETSVVVPRPVRNSLNGGATLNREQYIDLLEGLVYPGDQERVGIGITTIEPDGGVTSEQEAEAFLSRISRRPSNSAGKKSVLLYVHGYNQSFSDDVFTAAQLAVDIRFTNDTGVLPNRDSDDPYPLGRPMIFSWPAWRMIEEQEKEDLLAKVQRGISIPVSYYVSQQQADRTATYFADFLQNLLVGNSEISEVNMVVHSMGNRVLFKALGILRDRGVDVGNSTRTINIVHAAADVGHVEYKKFIREWNPQRVSSPFKNANINIYMSSDDVALKASQWANQTCRLGLFSYLGCLRPFVERADNFVTVDTSGVIGTDEFSHGYFANSAPTVADLGCALLGYSPRKGQSQRSLSPVEFKYWLFGKKQTYWKLGNLSGIDGCRATKFRDIAVEGQGAQFDEPLTLVGVLPERETMYWKYADIRIIDLGDNSSQSEIPDMARRLVNNNRHLLCSGTAVAVIGLSSREGVRGDNEVLATQRATILAHALDAEVSHSCNESVPKIFPISLGQACRSDCQSYSDIRQSEEDGSLKERPVIILVFKGGVQFPTNLESQVRALLRDGRVLDSIFPDRSFPWYVTAYSNLN